MNDQDPEATDATVEELVAYLDGELDADNSRRVDERLSSDPTVQAEVHRLERTWELLDELPRAEVDETFTRSTVTMVALAASEDLAVEVARRPSRFRRRTLVLGGAVLAASLAGFAAVRLLSPDPNEQLLRELRVYQDLDPYRQAGDIEFLRLLRDDGVFAEEVGNES